MNKFFVPNKVYNKRIKICKSCEHYFKPTRSCKVCKCFMKIKARIAPMECPEGFWKKSLEMERTLQIPKEMIEEVLRVFPKLNLGTAKTFEDKAQIIELYNTIYNSNYAVNTNCGSCLQSCYQGIKKIYEEHSQNNRNE